MWGMIAMRDEIAEGVREVFEAVLGRMVLPDEEVRRDDEPKWDSLKHVELIFALEDRFGVCFSEEEMETLDSSSMIIELLTRRDAA